MFYKRTPLDSKEKSRYGRVYVLRFELEDTIVWKVGMTRSDRSLDRMLEILRSFFITYRYIPKVTMRRDKKVIVPLLVEQHMHDALEDYSHTFDKKFDGCTEFFSDLDEDILLDYLDSFRYETLLEERTTIGLEDFEEISKEIRLLTDNERDLDAEDKLPF